MNILILINGSIILQGDNVSMEIGNEETIQEESVEREKSDGDDDADQEEDGDTDSDKENQETSFIYRHLSFEEDDVSPGRFCLVSHSHERLFPWIGKVSVERKRLYKSECLIPVLMAYKLKGNYWTSM